MESNGPIPDAGGNPAGDEREGGAAADEPKARDPRREAARKALAERQDRIDALRDEWQAERAKPGGADKERLAALEGRIEAIAGEVQAAADGASASGTALDGDRGKVLVDALFSDGAGVEGIDEWLKIPVQGIPDPIPADVQAKIGAFLVRWQAAGEAARDGLADEAARIAAALRGGDADSEGIGALRAAVDAAVAAGPVRNLWESIPEAPRRAREAAGIVGSYPDPILGVAGKVPGSDREWSGAVISVGTVAVLSGEGSVAKSGLTCDLAVGIASVPDGYKDKDDRDLHDLPGGLFKAQGGAVLMATYEDPASVTAFKLDGAAKLRRVDPQTLSRVHVLDMEGRPLFGPAEPKPRRDDRGEIIEAGRAGLYNARPEPLAGWFDLWREVARIKPVLVIVDPALAAYVGDASGAAPVREFITALLLKAREHRCGVLVVAHSTKAARGQDTDPLDPGAVSGSAAWFDAARGVMVMQFAKDSPPDVGIRTLSLPKVNYGHGRIGCSMAPERLHGGAIVGFSLAGKWDHLTATTRGEKEAKAKAEPGRVERPYNHAEAVIDAVNMLRTAAKITFPCLGNM